MTFFQKIKYLETKYPLVTYSIIVLCAVIWFLQVLSNSLVTQLLAFNPILAVTQPWRYVTAAFLHSDSVALSFGTISFPNPMHLIINMYTLWVVAPILERALGALKFAILYLLSAIGGNVLLGLWAVMLTATGQTSMQVHYASGGWLSSAVGASGAIFGVLVALILVLKKVRVNTTALVFVLALNLLLPLFDTGIAWQAHVGGGVTGAIITLGFVYLPEKLFKVQRLYNFEDFSQKAFGDEEPTDINSSIEQVTGITDPNSSHANRVSDDINKEKKSDRIVHDFIFRKHKRAFMTPANAWIFTTVAVVALQVIAVVVIDFNAPFTL